MLRWLAHALIVAAMLAAPTAAGGSDGWRRIEPGLQLEFPADHGAHPDTRIEWWYLTGQLEAADGRRFGFQFTVFRRGLALGDGPDGSSPLRPRQVLAGHLALTDVSAGETRFAERLRRAGSPLAHASEEDLDVAIDDWSLARVVGEDGAERLVLVAGDPKSGIGFDLQLSPSKPLVLHGKNGYSSKGSDPGNASAYISWTRLATSGSLRLDGEELAVRGEAWFDHEFGTSVLEPGIVGWDWFGLHLTDGRELMAFVLRRADGTWAPASAGTLIERDGTPRPLTARDFEITHRETWESPRTGGVYPARWTIEIPGEGLRLEVRPLVADCELGTRSTGVAYWEGPVEVTGTTSGRGYAELTGYAGSMEGRL
jgi:predicted secreted hydrolase